MTPSPQSSPEATAAVNAILVMGAYADGVPKTGNRKQRRVKKAKAKKATKLTKSSLSIYRPLI